MVKDATNFEFLLTNGSRQTLYVKPGKFGLSILGGWAFASKSNLESFDVAL